MRSAHLTIGSTLTLTHPGDARAVRVAGPDAGAMAARALDRKKRKLRRKHSGSESQHFLETAMPKNRQRRRAMVRSHLDRRENLKRSKSLRPAFTSATCRSTLPRAISSNCSTVLDMFKTPRS